jgi:phosphoribosylamine--glycine ligase
MKVLLLGSGASIHALAWKIVSAPRVRELYCAPGNAGTALLVGTPPVSLSQEAEVVQWAFSKQIDLVVVQRMPRWTDMLVGVGLQVVGAGEAQWQAFSSRQSSRDRLRRQGVPCVEGQTFRDLQPAERYLASRALPLWVRPDDNLRRDALKIEDRYTGFQELARLMESVPEAKVCLETVVQGQEVNLSLLTDGQRVIPFGVSRSYDRRYDGGAGPMTSGMGAFAPFKDHELADELTETLGRPVVAALAAEGILRPCFLSLRVILSKQGPILRDLTWGLDDVHAAVTLPLWGGDLAGVLEWVAQGRLEEGFSSWWPGVAVVVAMVVEGYPGPTPEGYPVHGLYESELLVFHDDTHLDLGRLSSSAEGVPLQITSTGGRVLLVVGYASTGPQARRKAYGGVHRLEFHHRAWRQDIAAELE